MSTEIWRPLHSFFGDIYEASNHGRIRSIDRYVNNNGTQVFRRGVVLSQSIVGSGYMGVNIYNVSANYRQSNRVHRLVLSAFNPIDGWEDLDVNHIDGDKLNNKLHNLEWATRKENIRHAHELGLFPKRESTYYSFKCKACGKDFKDRSRHRVNCSKECDIISRRPVKNIPSKIELYGKLSKESFTSVGKHYSVSCNTIRNWCKDYNIPHHAHYYKKYR